MPQGEPTDLNTIAVKISDQYWPSLKQTSGIPEKNTGVTDNINNECVSFNNSAA